MEIVGGKPLKGEVIASGAKNALLPILAASVMLEGETNLTVETRISPKLGGILAVKTKLEQSRLTLTR